MWVNETRENEFTFGVDNYRALWRFDIAVNARDGFALAEDVCDVTFARGYDFAILDKE
jgi:hypothetical protein